ncbi:hypothetical protein [Halovivax gelatinilyticus]|uniref:hypothetical protein n=1 Tax=Halovivax gelatinilyticus TaxID=2961597 RepID=UPI0020CA843D|nr:hypothetical protein [Halovivax gelatinilyticus]
MTDDGETTVEPDEPATDEHADDTATGEAVNGSVTSEPADGSTADDVEDEPAEPERSTISDELDVPSRPPDPESTSHVLPDEKLRYPDFEFEEGSMTSDASFDLSRSLDREEMRAWLDELQGGLASHDVGVSTETDAAIFGVGAGDVSVSFDPDENFRGKLEFTFSIDAKLMTFADDPTVKKAGSRGGKGFIPIQMLTDDREARTYRCYNWIDQPVHGERDEDAE